MQYESSSEEEELPKTPSLCYVNSREYEFVVASKPTIDYSIKLETNSFEFRRKNNTIFIQLHRMFIWRLLHSKKSAEHEVNLFRVRDLVTRIKSHTINMSISNGELSLDMNGQSKTAKKVESPILEDFDKLYFATQRKYDATLFIDNILATTINLLSAVVVHC